jgi:hypothetical protein
MNNILFIILTFLNNIGNINEGLWLEEKIQLTN